jgi:hypothetical protein
MTTIYTIGYTGTRPEQLAATVHKLGAFLLDIRYNPRASWATPTIATADRLSWPIRMPQYRLSGRS